jgi:hypothetical protein
MPVISAKKKVKAGKSHSMTNPGLKSTRPYLKNKLKQKGVEAWIK